MDWILRYIRTYLVACNVPDVDTAAVAVQNNVVAIIRVKIPMLKIVMRCLLMRMSGSMSEK